MNEAQFKQAINRHIKRLCPEIYIWCIADKYTSGIPDCYYSHHKDLWVELKFGSKSYGLTERQKQWIVDRAAQGRETTIIHGYPDKCEIYKPKNGELTLHTTTSTIKDAAKWIINAISTQSKSDTTHQETTPSLSTQLSRSKAQNRTNSTDNTKTESKPNTKQSKASTQYSNSSTPGLPLINCCLLIHSQGQLQKTQFTTS